MKEPTITAAATGREPTTDREQNNEVFAPTEDWIKQYQKQAAPKLIAGLNQYARTRVATGLRGDHSTRITGTQGTTQIWGQERKVAQLEGPV